MTSTRRAMHQPAANRPLPGSVSVEDAAGLVRSGGAVVLPSDTVYLLVALPASEAGAGLARGAAQAAGKDEPPVAAWIPPFGWEFPRKNTSAGDGSLLLTGGAHRLIAERLTPGPVVLYGEDSAAKNAVRRSNHPVIQGVLSRLDGAPDGLIGAEIPDERSIWSDWPGGPGDTAGTGWADTPEQAVRALALTGISIGGVVDGGRLSPGKPATVIRLLPTGGYRVVRAGVYEERFVDKQLERTILFVCSGNTCRSPMAEAIAADLLEREVRSPVKTTVLSAGTGAAAGMPPAGEALRALKEGGVTTGDRLRGSRPLSRQLIQQADVIFVMTPSHLQTVVRLEPGARARTMMLDPTGKEIPDPIGQGLAAYTETARRLRELIAARLKELDS